MIILILPNLVFGQVVEDPNSLDGQFSTPTNLSDKQMDEAKNFIHQGQKDRIIKEKCAAANNCEDKGEGFPIETLIGKAYTVLGMFSGDGMMPEIKMKPTENQMKAVEGKTGADGKPLKPEQDKKKDYCMLIATAYETVGTILQQQLQKKAENKTVQGDEQLQSLVSLQETHKAREKTAKIQSYVYGTVTTCYGAMLATGAQADTSFILKMGGAAALTGLYISKANKHKKAAEKVGDVIAALDWAGKNCNPWTKSKCFCSEPTSKDVYPDHYQEVCVLNKGNFDTPKIALGCAAMNGDKVSYDQDCKCKQTNTCMKANFTAYSPKLGTGVNLMSDVNKTLDMITTGDIDQAQLDRATIASMALAKKVSANKKLKLKTPELTAEQQAMAKELAQYMPESAAALMASAQPTMKPGLEVTAPGNSAISKISQEVRDQLGDAIKVDYKQNYSSTYSRDDDDFVLPKMPGMETEQKDGTEVLTFAEKAISKADVTNSPSTPIFDIISNRYRRSGWSKLDTEGK